MIKIISRVEDSQETYTYGFTNVEIAEDPLIIGHTLDETRSNSLKALAFFYSEYGGYERALDFYKKTHKIDNYLDIDEDLLKEYAIMDAIVAWRVPKNILKHMRELDKKHKNDKFEANTLEEYYRTRRIPAANLYARMEYQGMCINKPKLDALRVQMKDYVNKLKLEIAEQLGVSSQFDFESATKLGKLLESLGWEDFGRNKAGIFNTSDFQLERWKKNHPEAKLLQTMRSVNTLLNTFVGDEEGTKGWPQYMIHHDFDKPEVYRIHADFFPMGTDTGRTRCTKPNLQNIPTRGLFTKEIKACICTPDDSEYYLVTVDYSALQMRLAAIDCLDKNLTEVFMRPDADAHSMTAVNSFCIDKEFEIEEIDVEQNGKMYHFLGPERVKTKRGYIKARDLNEEDEIIE